MTVFTIRHILPQSLRARLWGVRESWVSTLDLNIIIRFVYHKGLSEQ